MIKRIDWLAHANFINIAYWFTATTKTTSMSLGSQKGFMTDRSNEPPK